MIRTKTRKTTIIFDKEIIQKSQKHSSDIERLINKIDKEFQKIMNSLPNDFKNSDISIEKLSYFKRFNDLYSICLIEICSEIQFFGLDYLCILLLKLFNCFKLQQLFFMKYNTEYLNLRNELESELEKELKDLKGIYEQEIINLRKQGIIVNEEIQFGIFRRKIDKFERLEKAKFYFEQEEAELDKLVININRGKDEIEYYLKNEKRLLDKVAPSGTKQILLALLRSMKLPEQKLKELEEEMISSYDDTQAIKFEMIKTQFLSKVDESSKKAFMKYLNTHMKKTSEEQDKETQTEQLTPPEINDEKGKKKASTKKSGRTQTKKKSILDENDFDTEREDYELKFKGLKEKIVALEEKLSNQKNDKDNQEFKIFKKKTKIKTLKEEIEKLKSKLEVYDSKDLDKKMKEKLRKNKENEERFTEEKFKAKFDEYIEIVHQYEEKQHLSAIENENQRTQMISLQTEVEQLKQLIELLQEKKEIDLNEKEPDSFREGSPKSSRSPKATSPQSHESPSNNEQELKKIELNLILPKQIEKNYNIKEEISDKRPAELKKAAKSSKSKSPKNKNSLFLSKTPGLRKKISIVEVKSPNGMKKNIKQEKNLENEKEKDKNVQTTDDQFVVEKEKITMESKESNTESITFSNNYNMDDKIMQSLEKIDFSNENIRLNFQNFVSKLLEDKDLSIKNFQKEFDNLFIPTLESVSTNLNNIAEETLNLNLKALEIPQQINEKILNSTTYKKNHNSIDFNEILNSSKISSTKLDISNFESQKNIPNKNRSAIEIYDNAEKLNKYTKKPSLKNNNNNKSSLISLPFLNTSLENTEIIPPTKLKGYITPQTFTEPVKQVHSSSMPKSNEMKNSFEQKKTAINLKNYLNYLENKPNIIKTSIPTNPGPLEEYDLTKGKISKSIHDLSMGYTSEEKLTKWKPEDKEVIQEEEEQSLIAKEIFEHLTKTVKSNTDANYSKFKHFFNYPFKKIEDFKKDNQVDPLAKTILNEQDKLTFETFSALFTRLIQAHKKCGKNCKHLQRFYKTIGFVKNSEKKHLLDISKKVISKLPKI